MAAEYYKDKEVFLTGGSGILGKGIIEKLLRSTDIKRIYMLIRTKRNKSVEERLDGIKKGTMFDRIRQERPSALDKLISISGDICQPLLGMTEESFLLTKNVDIVINSAATIRFDEPLRDAILKNVGGTLECIKVAQKMNDVKLFLHVSTYFSNPGESFIKNIVYPPPVDWRLALKISQSNISDETLEAFSRKYIDKFPNTYSFTKNLSEKVVADHQHLFPVMITRPSVILCAKHEPYNGYVEKMQGVTGIVAFVGTGLLHSVYANPDAFLDVMWADLVVNVHILSIARVGLKKQKLTKPEVVLICCYPHDKANFKVRFDRIVEAQRRNPFSKCFGHYNVKIVSCYYHYVIRFVVYQVLPSIFLDLILKALKMKPMVLASQRKLFAGSKDLEYFCSRSFHSDGVTNLAELMLMTKDADFKLDSLFMSTNDAAIATSFDALVLGTRRYLSKEDDSSLPSARKRYKIIEYVTHFKNALFYILATWLLFKYIL